SRKERSASYFAGEGGGGRSVSGGVCAGGIESGGVGACGILPAGWAADPPGVAAGAACAGLVPIGAPSPACVPPGEPPGATPGEPPAGSPDGVSSGAPRPRPGAGGTAVVP